MPPTAEPPHRADGARPRRRLAALSAVGAVVIALPLVQVLRFQADELAAVRSERAGLDPMAHAVDVQWKLVLHRDLSSRVLRGQTTLEPQRLQGQQQVDTTAATLAADFKSGLWARASRESEALQVHWSQLKSSIGARRLTAMQSDTAHRLLIEHCLQITDDLADVLALQLGLSADATASNLRQLRDLPRELWRSTQAVPQTPALEREAAATSALLLERFAALRDTAAVSLTARDATLSRQRAAVMAAVVALLALAGGLLLQLLRKGHTPPRTPAAPAPLAVLRQRRSGQADPMTRSVMHRMRAVRPEVGAREAQDTLPPP